MADTERLLNKAQGDSIISALAQIAANILQVPSEKLIIDWSYTTLPASGDDHTIYAIPTGDADDPWNFYVWNDVDEEWVQFDWTFAVDSALSTTSENPVQNKVITTALGGKVDKVTGKGLSTNDYTTAEKEKLAGIEAGAQVNPTIDSALSDSSTNAVQNKVVKGALDGKADADDVEGTQTATGNPITLTDAAPINAESLVVEFSPKQDLHGQSAPYVGGAGKNKLPMTVDGIKAANTDGTWSGNAYTINGVTFTVLTDGDGNVTGIDYSGTPSANPGYAAMYIVNGVELPSGNYILNGGVSNNAFLDTSLSGSYVTSKGGDTPIVVSGSAAYVRAVVEGDTAYSGTLLPMIRLSTETDPTFAPYSNICPITGYTECNVDDVGKNKLNLSDYTGNSYAAYGFATTISGEDVIVTLTNYPMTGATESFEILMNTDAIFDKTGLSIKAFISSGDNYVSSVRWSNIQSNNNIAIDLKNLSQGLNATITMRIMVYDTSSGEPTTYEPYQFRTASVTFGQTVYGGRSNFTDGGTSDEIAFIKDTHITNISEGVDGNADWLNVVFTTDIDILLPDTVAHRQELAARSMSNYSGDWEYENVNGHVHFYSSARAIYAFYPKSVFPTLSDFTTYYANNKAEFAIPYETVTTLSTPQTDIKLLKSTNHITTNGTTINLGYQPDNVIGDTLKVAEDYTDRAVGKNILPMTLAGIKAANPHLTWTDETSFTSGNVTVTFQVAGGDIYGIHIVSTGSNGEFFNLCFDGVDYSRFDGCILSGCDVNDENKIYIAIRKYGGANYFAKNISGDTVINYTAGQKASIFVYLSSGSVDTVLKPMIRKPNMDNTYEPPKPSKEILMDLIAYLFTQI